MSHLSILDGIRAIAVLLVVVSHLLLQLTSGAEPAFYSYRTMGRVGVAIFFVHTTLVLMASLERNGAAAVPFYIRRLFRIYPLSVAAVLFFAFLQLVAGAPIDTGKLLSNLFLVQNVTGHASLPRPLWSLPYEVQMYLVLPLLYQVARSGNPVRWAILLWAGSLAAALALPAGSLAAKLVLYVPCFLPGVLAFVMARTMRARWHPAAYFAVVVAGGVVAVPMLAAAGVSEMPLLWGLCIALGATLPACRPLPDGRVARGAQLIATYSYGVYITHVLSLGAIDGLMPGPPPVQWAAMLILLPGLAYVSYHGIEKHGIALGVVLAARCSRRRREAPRAAGADRAG